jgi:hypothetical protein
VESGPRRFIGPGSLVLLLLVVYGMGLHPGLAEGDAAELQWAGPLLGICHSPGYALQVTALKLFTSLPMGSSPAWRANLFSLICGISGALALYGAVRRITGKSLAGWISASTLALSTVYWSHSLIAEVYVFGGALILFAVYASVRFVQNDDARWLTIAAISLGTAIAERPSEILIIPGFALAWFVMRKSAGITLHRGAAVGLAFVLPFTVAVALNLSRDDPARLAVRDDAIRNEIPGVDLSGEVTYQYESGIGYTSRVENALVHMLGLKWKPRLAAKNIPDNLKKFGWVISGLGIWGDRYAPAGQKDPMMKGGASLGAPALLLSILGIYFWRKQPGWILLGVGILAGNLIFALFYTAFDTMTFITPALIGLALLAGLGCSPPDPIESKRARTFSRVRGAALLLPLVLLLVNFSYVDRSTESTARQIQNRQEFIKIDWPRDSVILTTFWPAMTMRYSLRVAVDRPDIAVIHLEPKNVPAAHRYFQQRRRPVFATANALSAEARKRAIADTPRPLLRHNLYRLGGGL